MKKSVLVSLIMGLIIVVVCSGCIWEPMQKSERISLVSMNASLDYDEVMAIDTNTVTENLSALGFEVEASNTSSGMSINLRNWSHYNPNVAELSIHIIGIKYENGTTNAYFHASYRPSTPTRDEKSELDVAKQYIMTRCNEVADVCNLTLNWNTAKWVVSYGD